MSGWVPTVDTVTKRFSEPVEDALVAAVVAPVVEDRVGRLRFDVTTQPGMTPEQALAAAPAGSIAAIPPGIYTPPTGADNGFRVTADDVTVEMAPGAEIRVPTWGQAGIDAMGHDGVRIIGRGTVRYVGSRGDHTGSRRGGATYTAGAAAYFSGDRCEVNGLRSIGMPTGVYFSSWDGSSLVGHTGKGNIIRNFESEGMDFGLLFVVQQDLTIENLYGHDDIDDSGGANPTHVIYSSATPTYRAAGVTVSNLLAKNILFGQPYQFKYTDSMTASNWVARNSRGLANIQGCVDVTVTGLVATGALPVLGPPNGAITVQDITTARVKLSKIMLVADSAGHDQRMFFLCGNDCTVEDLQIVSKRVSGSGAGAGIAHSFGDRNTLRGLNITESSAQTAIGLLLGDVAGTYSTTDMQVSDVRMRGVYQGLHLYGPLSGTLRYESGMISASNAAWSKQGAGAVTMAVYRDNMLTVAGTPEGVTAAPVGSVAQRSDGSNGSALYVKETGSGNTGWAAVAPASSQPAAGMLIPDMDLWASTVAGPSGSDQVMLNYFTAYRSETIGTLTVATGTAAGATPTLCRMGLYSVAANGDLTLIASTPNDTALFAAGSTSYAKSLSAPAALVAGERYAAAVLVVSGAAMPTFVGHSTGSATAATVLTALVVPRRLGRVLAQTNLPSSVAAGSVSAVAHRIGMRLS